MGKGGRIPIYNLPSQRLNHVVSDVISDSFFTHQVVDVTDGTVPLHLNPYVEALTHSGAAFVGRAFREVTEVK